jgi:hypothetical protein
MTEADLTFDPHVLRIRTPEGQMIGHLLEQ